MKKFATLFIAGSLFLGASQAAVLEDAIQWGYDKGLTSFSTTSTFRAYDTLRRDEAAKFFVEFTRFHGNANYVYGNSCSFYDLNKSRSDLKTYVVDACSYGFLKGNGNYVLPDQKLTNAQTITVVVRMIDGYQSESWISHRADNYYKRAMELGLDISKFWEKDVAASRGNVMMLLYNAANGASISGGTSGNGSVDNILQQVVDILEE